MISWKSYEDHRRFLGIQTSIINSFLVLIRGVYNFFHGNCTGTIYGFLVFIEGSYMTSW